MDSKPFTVPNDRAPDAAFVRCYATLIAQDARWLTGLRRPDGRLYLTTDTAHYSYTLNGKNSQASA